MTMKYRVLNVEGAEVAIVRRMSKSAFNSLEFEGIKNEAGRKRDGCDRGDV